MKKPSFEKVNLEKLISNLKSFRTQDDFLKIWQKNYQSWKVKLREISENKDECKITILPLGELEPQTEKPILLNFKHGGVDYFAETEYVSKSSSIIELKLTDKLFMLEKRSQERLICFPDKDLQFIIDIPSPESSQAGVLFFDKDKREEVDFLKEFRSRYLERNRGNKEGFESISFQLIDISKTGLSFYCSDSEYEFYKINEFIKNGYLIIDKEVINIQLDKVVYEVDFINPKARSIPMKKIGLSIVEDKNLNTYLEKLKNSLEVLTENEKEFEDLQV